VPIVPVYWGSIAEPDVTNLTPSLKLSLGKTSHITLGPGATTVSAVAKLVYATIMSLDGYTTDVKGNIDWGAPEPDVFAFINDLERGIGTHLYGRKMYETMVFWETSDASEDQPLLDRDFAEMWRAAAKVVYSKTLAEAIWPSPREPDTWLCGQQVAMCEA
jgi:hypothetical protein